MLAARADVADLGAEVAADLLLHRQVEVMRVRRLEVLAPADEGEAGREVASAPPLIDVERIRAA